jgi:hypothetical protein
MSDEAMPEHLPAFQTAGQMRLAKLLKALFKARKQFDPTAHDRGRSSVCHALRALIDYVSETADTRPDIVTPLRELLWGLKNLDDGTVVGLLEANELRNRAPDSTAVKVFRASAAVLMQLKHEQGNNLAAAATSVAYQLNRQGYRDRGQRITAKRIKAWRETVMGMADQEEVGVGRYRFALKLLRGRFPSDPKAAFDCYLDMMPDIDRPEIPEKPGS